MRVLTRINYLGATASLGVRGFPKSNCALNLDIMVLWSKGRPPAGGGIM